MPFVTLTEPQYNARVKIHHCFSMPHDEKSEHEYWAKRRWRWDEWGSPVGLGLGWALFIVPVGLFLYLLHLAGLLAR